MSGSTPTIASRPTTRCIPYVGIQNGWSERVTAGATWTFRGGPSLSLGGELGGIGAAYDLWSANARVDWPF